MSTISIPRLFGFKRIKVNYAKALDESTAGVSVSPDKRYSLLSSPLKDLDIHHVCAKITLVGVINRDKKALLR
jgi:hypothetical protein